MEDNNAQNIPIFCANGCGFYGNPINNNMCSKCFKEVSQKNNVAAASSNPSDPAVSVNTTDSTVAAAMATTTTTATTTTPPSPMPMVTQPEILTPHFAPAAVTPPSMTVISSAPAPSQTPAPVTVSVPHAPRPQPCMPMIPAPMLAPAPVHTPSPVHHEPECPASGERPVQANKGRCFMCRAKIPLAKQTINKCRCEYVFCDTHKAVERHDCDFDFAKMGKDQLTKANPKLNDKPRGGRSFTRLD